MLNDVWGYNVDTKNGPNYELLTHGAGASDLQKYTDPIFRTIDKLKKGRVIIPYNDIYEKLKSSRLLYTKVCQTIMKRAIAEPGFKAELRSLADYAPTSYHMKVLAACAASLFDISNGDFDAALERLVALRKYYIKAFDL